MGPNLSARSVVLISCCSLMVIFTLSATCQLLEVRYRHQNVGAKPWQRGRSPKDRTPAGKSTWEVHKSSSYSDARFSTASQSLNAFVSIVVIVTSAAGWSDRRERIRQQFPKNLRLIANDFESSVVLKFAFGTGGLSNDTFHSVRSEASRFEDILFFDCPDEDDELKHPHLWRRDAGTSSTTCKVMMSVRWAVQHYNFDYFFRLGDDSYFRVDKFAEMLSKSQIPINNAVVGHIMTDQVFGMQQLYPQGMGYGLTYDVCAFIAANTDSLLLTAPEDCVVARWLFAIGAEFVDSGRWRDIHMGDSCQPDMVLAHKLPEEKWSSIADDGTVDC